MPDQRILCVTCKHLVRPEHFPCAKAKRDKLKREAKGKENDNTDKKDSRVDSRNNRPMDVLTTGSPAG